MATRKATGDQSGAGAGQSGSGPQSAQGFEQAMERLEKIVHDMEGGALNLEDMIARFEEGQKLIKLCTSKLNEVEKKVEVLLQKEGKTVTEPLEEFGEEECAEEPESKPNVQGDGDLFR